MLNQTSKLMMMLCCLIALSACSERAIVQQAPEYVSIPKTLLNEPCKASEAGETLSSLAQAYINNNGCIGEYAVRLKKLNEWNNEQLRIYSNPK